MKQAGCEVSLFFYFCTKQKEMENILTNHRSIRKYTSERIASSLIEELIKAATCASTTGNMQLYSIIATEEEKTKKQLAPCHFNQPMITEAPLVLTFCADYNRFCKWCEQRNATPGYDNFHSFLTATIDTLLVAQNFCIAAESRGLGICYLGTTTYNAEQIIDILELPKFVVPITTITVGYPEIIPPKSDRLPVDAILHHEVYHDYNKADIDKYYAYKESLEENRKFVSENRKESLAQIFTDIRYTKKDNEAITEMLLKTLQKQGFKFGF